MSLRPMVSSFALVNKSFTIGAPTTCIIGATFNTFRRRGGNNRVSRNVYCLRPNGFSKLVGEYRTTPPPPSPPPEETRGSLDVETPNRKSLHQRRVWTHWPNDENAGGTANTRTHVTQRRRSFQSCWLLRKFIYFFLREHTEIVSFVTLRKKNVFYTKSLQKVSVRHLLDPQTSSFSLSFSL